MKLIVFASIVLLVSPSMVQAASPPPEPPTIEQLQAQYLIETGQLRQALGQAHAQIIELRKQLEAVKSSEEKK